MTSPNDPIHVVCRHCAAVNRVPAARRDQSPQCGVCSGPLFGGGPIALDEARFERYVGRSDLPVLVDFWAPWCGPCRTMAPQFEQAAQQLAGQVLFAKVDTDAQPGLSARFSIRSIPTLVLMQGGREVDRVSGALSAAQLTRWLSRPR